MPLESLGRCSCLVHLELRFPGCKQLGGSIWMRCAENFSSLSGERCFFFFFCLASGLQLGNFFCTHFGIVTTKKAQQLKLVISEWGFSKKTLPSSLAVRRFAPRKMGSKSPEKTASSEPTRLLRSMAGLGTALQAGSDMVVM